ncbi:MAG: hypothetical protein ACE5G5_13500 [Candidatus Methylomirabilales bacterium]
MALLDPLREGFCWDHGFYAALVCPRCSNGSSSNGKAIEVKESEAETPLAYQVKEKQLAHKG